MMIWCDGGGVIAKLQLSCSPQPVFSRLLELFYVVSRPHIVQKTLINFLNKKALSLTIFF